jgi:hypothetical protein
MAIIDYQRIIRIRELPEQVSKLLVVNCMLLIDIVNSEEFHIVIPILRLKLDQFAGI